MYKLLPLQQSRTLCFFFCIDVVFVFFCASQQPKVVSHQYIVSPSLVKETIKAAPFEKDRRDLGKIIVQKYWRRNNTWFWLFVWFVRICRNIMFYIGGNHKNKKTTSKTPFGRQLWIQDVWPNNKLGHQMKGTSMCVYQLLYWCSLPMYFF